MAGLLPIAGTATASQPDTDDGLTYRLWDIPINWRQSCQVTLEARTEILKSRSGREQRVALRQTPRKHLEFLVTCAKDRYRSLINHMAAGQGNIFDVGDFSTSTISSTAAVQGDDRITVESVPYWALNGRHVVLSAGAQIARYRVSYVDGSTLVLTSLLREAWPSGTQISAVVNGRLATGQSARAITNAVVEAVIAMDVDPGTEADETPPPPDVTFNGREVFLLKPNWGEPIALAFPSGSETVDYGQGRIASFLPVTFPQDTMRAVYIGRKRDEIDAIRHFFLRMMGQQGEFYMPSQMADIQPAAALVSAQNYLTVTGTDFAAVYGSDTVHKAIAVFLNDGTTIYRQVASVAPNGTDSRLTIVSTWGADIALDAILMVSWMPAWRLMSDSLTLEYITSGVGRTTLTMKTLEDLTGE